MSDITSDITDRLQHAADYFPRIEDNPYSVFVDAKVEIERLRSQDGEKPAVGEMVSIDVSMCDEDNGNRVFGEIIDWQDDGQGERIWLCSLDHYNYTRPSNTVLADDAKHQSIIIQAQMWAQEARTQKAIVMEIGKLVGCKNDWEMVEAVKAALARTVVPGEPTRIMCEAGACVPLRNKQTEVQWVGEIFRAMMDASPQKPSAVVLENWKLLPEDLETHLGDFKEAVSQAAKNDRGGEGYWLHQLRTIENIERMIADALSPPKQESHHE